MDQQIVEDIVVNVHLQKIRIKEEIMKLVFLEEKNVRALEIAFLNHQDIV